MVERHLDGSHEASEQHQRLAFLFIYDNGHEENYPFDKVTTGPVGKGMVMGCQALTSRISVVQEYRACNLRGKVGR